MKRFAWPLQRLLEVTVQRERAQSAELAVVSRRIAEVRAEIARRRDTIRRMIDELARTDLATRISRQQIVLKASEIEERAIGRLGDRLNQLREERSEKLEQLLKTKSSRRTLERLREEAGRKYRRERAGFEQKRLDEAATGSFARKALLARTSGA